MLLDYFVYLLALSLITSSFAIIHLISKTSKLQKELDLHHGGIKIRKGKLENTNVSKKAAEHVEKAYILEKEAYELLKEAEKLDIRDIESRNNVIKKSLEINLQRLDELSLAVREGFNPYIDYNDSKIKLSRLIEIQLVDVLNIIDMLNQQPIPTKKKPNLKIIKD